jgi:hypothetical protein
VALGIWTTKQTAQHHLGTSGGWPPAAFGCGDGNGDYWQQCANSAADAGGRRNAIMAGE